MLQIGQKYNPIKVNRAELIIVDNFLELNVSGIHTDA
jgi:hypothetical protein